jgi:hypothetical protein
VSIKRTRSIAPGSPPMNSISWPGAGDIPRGWLELHESCTFVKLTQSGAALFA